MSKFEKLLRFNRALRIMGALALPLFPLAESACTSTPPIIEPAAGNGLPDIDPTALPLAAPTEVRSAPETAAPATTGAEAAASPTPSYSDANGGNYSPEVRSIVDQQSESLTSRLIDGRYIAGRSNLEREYSPEAGLIFAKIIGAPIEHYDIEGNLIASYPPGTRVMESQIQGNEGELLFFGPAGVNNSRRAAGLSEIPEDQMVFKLTADGIPYALTLDGVPLGSVMPTSNPDVAPWIPPEVLAVNPSIRVIKPVTEGQEWPKGGFDETGQTLLAQMKQGGNWEVISAGASVVEATATPVTQAQESAPTPTSEPTEVLPSPTPEGPETYGLVFSTATEAEIGSALDTLARENKLPLQYYSDFQGYEMWGVLANSKIVQRDFEGGYKVVYQAEFHYIVNGETRQFDVNLLTTRDDGDLIRTSQTAIPRQLDNAALIRFSWKGLLAKPTIPIRLMINAPIQNELVNPHADPGDMQPNAFLTPIFNQLGFDNEALAEFVNSGDPEYLPMVDGRRFLPVPWMYPEN